MHGVDSSLRFLSRFDLIHANKFPKLQIFLLLHSLHRTRQLSALCCRPLVYWAIIWLSMQLLCYHLRVSFTTSLKLNNTVLWLLNSMERFLVEVTLRWCILLLVVLNCTRLLHNDNISQLLNSFVGRWVNMWAGSRHLWQTVSGEIIARLLSFLQTQLVPQLLFFI